MVKNLDSPLGHLIHLEKDAREFGFDWPHNDAIVDQVISECQEIREALKNNEPRLRVQEEIGDLLHAAISLCVFEGYSVIETLTKVTEKFDARMLALKAIAKERGYETLKGESFNAMLKLWDEAKQRTK